MKNIILTLLYVTILTATSYAKTIPTDQKIAGLYVAFFNRAPDMSGLSYWTNRANIAQTNGQGASGVFKELSKGFATHPVFTSTYASLDDEAFVKAIYVNSLGREGDSEGITYWTNQLNNGLSRSDMVATFIELSLTLDLTPQNFPNLSQSELDAAKLRQDLITNKTVVALAFVNKLGSKTNVADAQDPENDPAYKASIEILVAITQDEDTVTQAIGYINSISNDNNLEYPLHANIVATTFWVGEASSEDNKYISNFASAWDDNWMNDYGGIDDPQNRNDYYPAQFIPLENPFYFALPYNDFDENGSKKDNDLKFLLKNRWIKIIYQGKTAYAQWEDVGPIESNDIAYIFGNKTPKSDFNNHAGLDVSPAVRDYLGLSGDNIVSWKFIEQNSVPSGPWKEIVTTSGINWTSWYKPKSDVSWQWQLTGKINTSYKVDIYDIDLFDTDSELIDELHEQGKKVICYFSAGSYEEWRSDAKNFPQELLGNDLDGWPGERWLDIRDEKIKQIMQQRLDMAKDKGCDGVEPDNVDGYTNNTGFSINSDEQLVFNKFLANEAHKRGLSVGLKNDLEQIDQLELFFDFAINEQCHIYEECYYLQPFIKSKKPVFNIEYNEKFVSNKNSEKEELCQNSAEIGMYTLILPKNLDDSFRDSCKK